jgi:hypothetical protein
MYEPLKVFTYIGLVIVTAGVAISLRFLYHYLTGATFGGRFLQSLILSAVLLIVGFLVLLIGLLADVISANRKLLEDLVYRIRSLEVPKESARPEVETEPVAQARSRGSSRDHDRWER